MIKGYQEIFVLDGNQSNFIEETAKGIVIDAKGGIVKIGNAVMIPIKENIDTTSITLPTGFTAYSTASGKLLTWNGAAWVDKYESKHTVVNHGTNDTTFALTPNILHVWGEVTSLTLTLATPSDADAVNEYIFQFTSGSTATTMFLPSSVKWMKEQTIETGHTYQVSILNNIAVIGGVES